MPRPHKKKRSFVCEDRTGWKGHEVQAGTARSWNDGVRISVKILLTSEIWDRRVDPHERVLVTGNRLELISQQWFVALDDGLAVYIPRDDATVSTWLLTTLGQLSFLSPIHG